MAQISNMLNRASNKTSTVKRLANNLVATFSWGGYYGGIHRGGVDTPILTPLSGIYKVSTDGIAGFQIYWNFHLIGSKWIVFPKITFEYIRFKLHDANIWSSPLWNETPCIVPNKNFAVVKIQFRFCCYGRLNHIFQI